MSRIREEQAQFMFSLRMQWGGVQASHLRNADVQNVSGRNVRLKRIACHPIVIEIENEPDNLISFKSPSPKMPFGLFWVGELYNKEELDRDLQLGLGALTGDTVLAAYAKWGKACLPRFEGEFSLIIWNGEGDRALIASDPMGVRTLYYYQTPEALLVASDASLLAQNIRPRPKISHKGLLLWLLNGYCESITLFEGVAALNPAHALRVSRDTAQVWRYWDVRDVADIRYVKTSEYADHLLNLLKTCVSDRSEGCRAGVMLSGGLDSAAVTALAAASSGSDLTAYTYRFHRLRACDEWPLAASVAAKWGLPHQALDAEAHWLFQNWQKQPWRRQPFHSWDCLTDLAMAEMASKGMTTLLTGHGGDNMFSGFSPLALSGLALRFLSSGALGRFQVALKQKRISFPRGFYRYVVRAHWRAFRERRDKWPGKFPWISQRACSQWFPEGVPWRPRVTEKDPCRQRMIWLVNDYTMGVRRAIHWYREMGEPHGIGVKHPLFDRRLAAFAVGIPPELARIDTLPKSLLRRSLKAYLPEPVMANRLKPSLAAYYHQGISREQNTLKQLMQGSFLAEMKLIDEEKVNQAVQHYINGNPDEVIAWFFPVLCTEIWIRKAFKEGFSVGRP